MSSVAQTILDQLGGGRFSVMTGAKNFLATDGGSTLAFRLPSKPGFVRDKINVVEITLTPADTYTMKFRRLVNSNMTIQDVRVVEDVYNDELQRVFTQVTGLDTRL